MEQQEVVSLYTKKLKLYVRVFVHLLSYEQGIEAFLKKHTEWFPSHAVILDAGCGTGALSRALSRVLPSDKFSSLKITGFDITPAMLSNFSHWIDQKKVKNISVIEADVLKISLDAIPPKSYDIVMTASMLEYVPRREFSHALSNLKRALRQNGKLLLFISKDSFLNLILIKIWWKAYLYAKKDLVRSLEGVGFTHITFHTFPGMYGYLNRWGYIIEAENKEYNT